MRNYTALSESVHSGDLITALGDYVLSTICGLKAAGNNRVITAVGAGGDRDKTKRPEMADAACRYSDQRHPHFR